MYTVSSHVVGCCWFLFGWAAVHACKINREGSYALCIPRNSPNPQDCNFSSTLGSGASLSIGRPPPPPPPQHTFWYGLSLFTIRFCVKISNKTKSRYGQCCLHTRMWWHSWERMMMGNMLTFLWSLWKVRESIFILGSNTCSFKPI